MHLILSNKNHLPITLFIITDYRFCNKQRKYLHSDSSSIDYPLLRLLHLLFKAIGTYKQPVLQELSCPIKQEAEFLLTLFSSYSTTLLYSLLCDSIAISALLLYSHIEALDHTIQLETI